MILSFCLRPEFVDKHVPLCEPHEPGWLFPIRKSQDATVGALVQMLRKAPPLWQNHSNLVNLSQANRPKTWSNCNHEPDRSSESHASVQRAGSSSVVSSRLISSKTTTDALQELQGYKTKKNLLIGKGSKSHK